jgi:hypothetical protein
MVSSPANICNFHHFSTVFSAFFGIDTGLLPNAGETWPFAAKFSAAGIREALANTIDLIDSAGEMRRRLS